MKNKLIIFAIFVIFLASLNFAFALDENATDLSTVDDAQDLKLTDSSDEDVAAVNDGDVPIPEVQTIKMDKVTKRYNGAIQYRASFYDEYGNPLKNTKVVFEVDDYNDYEATTDSNGVALLTILINKGGHKIAALNPVTLDISTDNINVFDVVTGGKNIKMYYDDGNTYKVRVFGDDGKPVKAGEKVTCTIGSKKYTKKTDKNGYAKLKITSKPGFHYIKATYKDFSIANSVYVKQVIKAQTGSLGRGNLKTVKVKIKYLGKNKKNKLIKVKFNKKTYKAKTNKKGVVIFKLKGPKKLGVYNLVAIYKNSKVSYTYTKYSG